MELLYKKTDIGRVRDCNEDSVTFIRHPKNKNIKLLAVADGMGGKSNGEVASNYTINTINKWFIDKDIKTLNNNEKVINLINKLIHKINNELIKKYGSDTLGTTLTMVIVNKNNSIIFNIGDSRTYIFKNKKIYQMTEDDSDVWYFYKYNYVKKEDLRYIACSNIINACIGINDKLCKISNKIIDNDYDMILLFSDGVTDLVTDKKMEKIINKNKGKKILDKIVYSAVNSKQRLFVPLRLKKILNLKLLVPIRGRDNASGVIYIK